MAILLLALALAGTAPQTRCGWLANPTPANWWLTDRDGEWLIGAQGGYQVPDDLPDMRARGWVEENGHYGYGCACMTVSVDPQSRRVLRIFSARSVPLRQCRADPQLRRR